MDDHRAKITLIIQFLKSKVEDFATTKALEAKV
jgi:hypothetical protein